MRNKIIRGGVAVFGLGLIAFGCWKAWEPLGYIVPGFLIWFDVFIETLRGRG